MRRLAVAAALALLAGPLSASAPAAKVPPQLRRDGRWLVDGAGRVTLLHGVNAVWKIKPYAPLSTPAGFRAADADFLAANGLNTMRLGVLFQGVLPQPGVIDSNYLDQIDRVVRLLASRHIWVLLDFHQDLFAEQFGGEGFPAWAVHDDGLPATNVGFPGTYLTPATSRAFDHLYDNTGGLVDRYAQAWRAVAARFRHSPYLMGYDLINEPFAGSAWPTCASPAGCPVFEQQQLQPFLDAARKAIRTVDPDNVVWFEPEVFFDFGADSGLGPVADKALGFSFHNYCLPAALTHASGIQGGQECDPLEGLVFDHAESAAQRIGATSLLSEFGASDDIGDLDRMVALADDRLTGWQYWMYKEWSDPTTESGSSGGQGLFTDDRDLRTLKAAKADVLIRPYAQAVAGRPTGMRFDPATKTFTLDYDARPATGDTDVFVPARHYKGGYAVSVTGARVVSRPGAPHLLLRSSGGHVHAVVTPRSSTSGGGGGAGGGTGGGGDNGGLAGTGAATWWAYAGLVLLAIAIALSPHVRRRCGRGRTGAARAD